MIAPLSPILRRHDPDAVGCRRPGHAPLGPAGPKPAPPQGARPGKGAWAERGPAKVPAYRVHRAKDLGYVRLNGRMVYLGRANSPESLAAYHRTVAEFLACGRMSGADRSKQGGSVAELVAAYLEYARGYYVDLEGNPSSGLEPVEAAAALLKGVYGGAPATEFGPVALRGLRHAMIGRDLCRNVINQRVCVVKRIFRWAVADERVPPAVYQALTCVEPLRRGRSGARETSPVRPVPDAHVDAVLPFLPPTVSAMVQLQRFTGMRSGEVCRLRSVDLDRSGAIWIYRPPLHKTSYRGHHRVVRLGPRAQAVLAPFLNGVADDTYIFSPRRAIRERARAKSGRDAATVRAAAPAPPSGQASAGPRRVGDRYVPRSYQRAIRYGIAAAERARAVPAGCHWHPHQLRHLRATQVRRAAGLEAARVLLGHRTLEQSLEYAEPDAQLADCVTIELG